MTRIKFYIVAFGFLFNVFTNLIGRIAISELLSLFFLPFVRVRLLFNKYPLLFFYCKCLTIFLFFLIISDIVNDSDFENFSKGWAMIIFSIITTIIYVTIFDKNKLNIVWILFGFFVSKLIMGADVISQTNFIENSNFFKSRIVIFINPLLLFISYFIHNSNKKYLNVIIFFTYSMLCIFLDARSNGLIFLFSSFLYFLYMRKTNLSGSNLFKYTIVFSSACYFLFPLYVNFVSSETIGGRNSLSQVSKLDNSNNPLELLIYGRSDFFVLISAIKDKPFFGHGSWAKDVNLKYQRIEADLSDRVFEYFNDNEHIRVHSIFLGSWVYAGIFGFITVSFLFLKLFSNFFVLLRSPNISPFFPIIIVLSFSMFWAFFFSPIGSFRTSVPFFAALLIVHNQNKYN